MPEEEIGNREIRDLRPGNIPDMWTIWDEAGLSYRPEGRDSRDELERQMLRDPDLFIGMFLNDRLIGVVIGSDDGRKGWINRLAVHPDHQGAGLGEELVAECERRLRERGREIICVFIEDGNELSLEFFGSRSYEVCRDIIYLRKRYSPSV